jgi:hypothetical protein
MDCAKTPPLGELRELILPITTRRVSEVRLVPRLRVLKLHTFLFRRNFSH